MWASSSLRFLMLTIGSSMHGLPLNGMPFYGQSFPWVFKRELKHMMMMTGSYRSMETGIVGSPSKSLEGSSTNIEVFLRCH